MKKLLICSIIASFVFCFSSLANAQMKDSGPYIGLGLAYAKETFDTDDLRGATSSATVDDTWGFNIVAGYTFVKYFAIEANFNWYDSFKLDTNLGSSDIDIWTVMLNGKVMYPLFENRLVPYAKAGIGWMYASMDSGNDNNIAWDFGGGIDYYITPNISVGLDIKYVIGTADLDDIEYYVGSIVAAYHF